MPAGKRKFSYKRRSHDEPEAPRQPRPAPEKLPPITEETTPEQRLQRYEKGRVLVASLATGLLECGEEWRSFDELSALHDICSDPDPRLRVLAVLSEMSVFVDILPDFRIDKPPEPGPGVTLSRPVLARRAYEAALVAAYHRFLMFLKTLLLETQRALKKLGKPKDARSAKHRESVEALELAGARAVSRLLTAKPDFNFRANLVEMVVPRMNSGRARVAEECCAAVVEIFKTDRHGELTLEIVRRVARILKAMDFAANPRVLETFLELDIVSAEIQINPNDPGSAARSEREGKDGAHVSKKQRKSDKAERVIEGEFKEAEATFSRAELRKVQTAILDSVFATYFRIIKRKGARSPLLAVALRGIARHAHQINTDFMSDIMRAVEEVMRDSAASGQAGAAFHCALAAFSALKTQGYCVDVDMKDFYTSVYAALFDLATAPAGPLPPAPGLVGREPKAREEAAESALHALELMLVEQKQTPLDRVAAFVKRIGTLALNQPPHIIAAILSLLCNLFTRFPKVKQMLSSEQMSGMGHYMPELEEPDHCNPWASVLWELPLLMNHYHPGVRRLVGQLLGGTEPPALRGSTPHEIAHRLGTDPTWGGVSLPSVPPKHTFKKRKGPVPDSEVLASSEAPEASAEGADFLKLFREARVQQRVEQLQRRRMRIQMAMRRYERVREERAAAATAAAGNPPQSKKLRRK